MRVSLNLNYSLNHWHTRSNQPLFVFASRCHRLRELARAQASMGQDQSQLAEAAEEPSPLPAEPAPLQAPSPAPSSLEELAAEAMSFSEDNNDSIDVKVQKALECPCVADLKSGPCDSGFIDAFSWIYRCIFVLPEEYRRREGCIFSSNY
nr:mitochondrial intermembrane space import and assembly protein 40 homolog isoform X2 [Lolium perenne]